MFTLQLPFNYSPHFCKVPCFEIKHYSFRLEEEFSIDLNVELNSIVGTVPIVVYQLGTGTNLITNLNS